MSASKMALCMIVKNEAVIIERCLASVAPHIDCYVILDTGSTDDTVGLIRQFFLRRGIPGCVHHGSFRNFETTRNEALHLAEQSADLAFDYLLLLDADMEFFAEPGWRDDLRGASVYTIKQTTPGMSYWNTRLIRRHAGARYVGVTHEYVSAPGDTAALTAAVFVDHADGSSRGEKYRRDIALLEQGLIDEPHNARYLFYLAQSYYETHQYDKAIEFYTKRAEIADFAEEAWYGRLQIARCYKSAGDDPKFIEAAWQAYNCRPHRAEPLYDLICFFRLLSQQHAALVLLSTALRIPYPDNDVLFIEDNIYRFGLFEEMSICGFYAQDPGQRRLAETYCNMLAQDRQIPVANRDLARRNQFYYVQPQPVIEFIRLTVDLPLPADWQLSNPSVMYALGALWTIVRVVNYMIRPDGSYAYAAGGTVNSMNVLQRRHPASFAVEQEWYIGVPADWRATANPGEVIKGFEDCRLYLWQDAVWLCATVLEQNTDCRCEIVRARLAVIIDDAASGDCRLVDWAVISRNCPQPDRHQKNWMPIAETGRFIYGVDPVIVLDSDGRACMRVDSVVRALDNKRGGSQLVAIGEHYLCLMHSVVHIENRRRYLHNWMLFDAQFNIAAVGKNFYWQHPEIEFVAGLTVLPATKDRTECLLVGFGSMDREAWFAVVDFAAVDVLQGFGYQIS